MCDGRTQLSALISQHSLLQWNGGVGDVQGVSAMAETEAFHHIQPHHAKAKANANVNVNANTKTNAGPPELLSALPKSLHPSETFRLLQMPYFGGKLYCFSVLAPSFPPLCLRAAAGFLHIGMFVPRVHTPLSALVCKLHPSIIPANKKFVECSCGHENTFLSL